MSDTGEHKPAKWQLPRKRHEAGKVRGPQKEASQGPPLSHSNQLVRIESQESGMAPVQGTLARIESQESGAAPVQGTPAESDAVTSALSANKPAQ